MTTAAELVAAADALRPRLLEEQEATEQRTKYSEELHDTFRELGFYRLLQPRRYGGLEVDVTTFFRVMMSISRGCPSTGWMLCLGSGHALQIGSYFPEDAQAEIFGDGHFVSPASFAFQDALARPVPGGYRVHGTWHFCSGAPYSTHHVGIAPTPDDDGRVLVVVVPRKDFEVLDNWGDLIGLKGSGSHSVVVEDALIPASHAITMEEFLGFDVESTPGSELHGNPLFGGAFVPFAMGELNSVQVGNAQAAVDEYERIITARRTFTPGVGEGAARSEDSDYQRCFGLGLAYTDAAYSIVERCGELYMDHARLAMEEGEPFGEELGFRMYGQLMTAHKLCWEAAETVFRTASTSGARDGTRMQRYWRDLCAFRTNGIHQLDFKARSIAQAKLGLPVDFFRQA